MWVVDHIDDLDADFLAIYGIEDMMRLPGPRWLNLAHRLFAFRGVMSARVRALDDDQRTASAAPSSDGTTTVGPDTGPATKTALMASDALSSVIEVGGH